MRHRRRRDPSKQWVPFTYGVTLGTFISFAYVLAGRTAETVGRPVIECFLPVNV